jgi:ADP-ribose pyrophosphatase YjhB (NUDIX family)
MSAKPTHSGGVVFRERNDHVEYLLIRAQSPQREWVLPKGHIERGESTRDAAVREVLEEAAVHAKIVAVLDVIEYTLRDQRIMVQFYLMRALRDAVVTEHDAPAEAEREFAWVPVEEAQQRLAYDTYRELVAAAERKRLAS